MHVRFYLAFCRFPFYRAWPGVRYVDTTNGLSIKEQKRETATITTTKSTTAQLKVMEVRDALHKVNGQYCIWWLQATVLRSIGTSFQQPWPIMSVVLTACICLSTELWAEGHGGVRERAEIQAGTGGRFVPLAGALEKPTEDTFYTQLRMTVRD